MQIYDGPTRRVLRKLNVNTARGFTVNGIVSQEEERAIYVRQKFTLKQYEEDAKENLEHMSDQWTFPEERGQFDVRAGNNANNTGALLPIPFTQKHTLSDRLLLNKSFSSVFFKPDNSHNFLTIENRVQAQLAPLLCSELQLTNVTRNPVITGIPSYEQPEVVRVQLGMYDRFWFGSVHVSGAGVPNRDGEASYYVTNQNAIVDHNNPEHYSAYGFSSELLFTQELTRNRGYIDFMYDPEKDVYRSKPFEVSVPQPLNQGEYYAPANLTNAGGLNYNVPPQDVANKPGFNDTIHDFQTYIVPSIETRPTQDATVRDNEDITPYNYFKNRDYAGDGDVTTRPRKHLPTPAQMVTGPANVNQVFREDRNLLDCIKIPLDSGKKSANRRIMGHELGGARILSDDFKEQMYLFIPNFRIVKGNKYSSSARARRLAGNYHVGGALRAIHRPWTTNDFQIPSMAEASANVVQSLELQREYWAFYEETRNNKQYVSESDWTKIITQASLDVSPKQMLNEPAPMWDIVKVGKFVIETPNDRVPLVCIQFEDGLPDEIEALITSIKTDVVDNRATADAPDVLVASHKDINFLFREKKQTDKQTAFTQHTESKGYYRLRLDECNRFATEDTQNMNGSTFALADGTEPWIDANDPFLPTTHADYRNGLWTYGRKIQVSNKNGHGAVFLKAGNSPFQNEAMYERAKRLPVGDEHGDNGAQQLHNYREASIAEAAQTPSNKVCGKPLDLRSNYNFMIHTHAHLQDEFFEVFPQPANIDGVRRLSNENYTKLQNFEIFLPVRRQTVNHFTGAKEVGVECIEPFFGYCTGTSQLDCQHPLDTRKFGKNFPLTIQDYTYTFLRDASPLLAQMKGYIKDPWSTLAITEDNDPEFTCISEKLPQTHQDNKDVMNIHEITPTIDHFFTSYSQGSVAKIDVETRSGMFEYLFLYLKYARGSSDLQTPLHDPVITQLEFKVRGRENLFVKVLDQYDIERISRNNCHKLCDWRYMHNHGQGTLLHLSDIGLTEEIAFPRRKRIQLEISLLADTTDLSTTTTLPDMREFHVAIIRQNQLLMGNVLGCKFSFVNES